jgi:cysteinyl-tRNA synthetase
MAPRVYCHEYKYLGNHFDIHGGGMDLKFRIMNVKFQNEACTGQTLLITGCMPT